MGDVTGMFVDCGECGIPLDARPNDPIEEREPCPACGSRRRMVRVYVEDEVSFRSMLSVKQKRPGESRPLVELKTGDEPFVQDGSFHTVERRVDRTTDPPWYSERIEAADGTVIREVSEPLADHQGRGSAKPKDDA